MRGRTLTSLRGLEGFCDGGFRSAFGFGGEGANKAACFVKKEGDVVVSGGGSGKGSDGVSGDIVERERGRRGWVWGVGLFGLFGCVTWDAWRWVRSRMGGMSFWRYERES